MIITKTPLRISFCGGGTDYPGWFRENSGLVVGGAINKHSYVTARWLPPFHDFKSRIVYNTIETPKSNEDIQHGVVRAIVDMLGIDDGIELMHACDIPCRSGTGSSSTFSVGVINALSNLLYSRNDKTPHPLLTPAHLADRAIHIERNVLAENGGWQDQIWAAYGGLNVIRFSGGEYTVTPLTLPCSKVKELESHLLLFFTGVHRTSSDIAASYAPTIAEMTSQQTAMLRITDNCINALYEYDWEKVGYWVDMSWRVKSSLSAEVSTESISHMYSVARLNKAWGGKITGAGGGGCLLLVAPPESHSNISAAMTGLGCVRIPFRFEHEGSRVLFYGREM